MTIYIAPFWVGVIWTIMVELGLLIGLAVYANIKAKRGKRK